MSVKIKGSSTAGEASVDGTGASQNLNVTLPQSGQVSQAGYALLLSEASFASDPGGSVRRSLEATDDYVLRTGQDQILLYSKFSGSTTSANAIQQDLWSQTLSSMTAVAGSGTGGVLSLNNGDSVTTNTGAYLTTYPAYEALAEYPLWVEFTARTVNGSIVNKTIELGWGLASTATSVGLLDGVAFRWGSDGTFKGVISLNGTETSTAALTVPSDSAIHRFTIGISLRSVEFWVDNTLQAVLKPTTGQVEASLQSCQPVLMRVYNPSGLTPASAPRLEIARVIVSQGNMPTGRTAAAIAAGMQQHCSQVPYGTAVGTPTVNITQSAIPTAGAGSNNTQLVTGLGGLWNMNAVVGNTAGTVNDLIAMAYQVPPSVRASTQGSKKLVITGLRLSCINMGAAVAGTPTTLFFQMCVGSTNAVALTSTDTATTKNYRHVALGFMSAPIGAVVGQGYDKDISILFGTPFVVNQTEFVAITCRFVVGTATPSQTVLGSVFFDGYWE